MTFDGYAPAKTLGYMLSERGLGSVNQALEWPTKAAASAVNFASHPYDTMVGIGQNIWSAAGSGADWATSPIPAQGLERAVDKLLAQSDQQAGGLIFDVASGLITAEIGGFAVKWVGGKWVQAEGSVKGSSNLGLADNLLPDADFVGRGVVRTDLKDHLVGATRSGKQISGGHDMENFMKELTESSGSISSKVEVAPGIYRVEYQLPKSTRDAVKTVYDPKVYPDMPNMANEAAYKALLQYQLTGNTLQEVVVGKVRFQVPVNIRDEQMYVPTAFLIGIVK
ncbi:CdiA family toxin C-terminal domain-containing protein [Pseudomonas syringae]|uniref:CdiA family toxin C-terminal domain-containing protein n=1 Tax=Pseudomonas syringae TaxID=317 RepID=UPI0015E17C8B|nr:CdiA family toxin C-terminal domain-containing protein [Pseudomonas syringae]MCK9697470.1 CdiA family toxin C-terminal domain-containing protein [Pseudomonas syringae pv. syringae]MCK9711977.1 CdiA family toxin C-terminal domain-containing protein [Pseudomonas syringae pv. syringae]MCK9727879.1 CdiA family toxin C-terminal domain-containing protein [Pseudomonas syringae pv. syringae]MCK9737282.1 CdiA family toxin C-terminal domain-containing protein [Pseudomonas syringae pv. syringae]MCK974